MVYDDERLEASPGSPLVRGVSRISYLFGVAVRRTVGAVSAPYRTVSMKLSTDGGSRGASSTRSEIVSRLSRMKDRLQSIERTLMASEGYSGPRPGRDGAERADLGTGRSKEEPYRSPLEGMTDSPARVRISALGRIGESAPEETTLLILEALHDPEPGVRCAAASAAARSRAFSTVFSLILLLDDSVELVRREARDAIEKITGRTIDFDPSDDPLIRAEKIEGLQEWWKEERFAKLSGELKSALKQWHKVRKQSAG